MSIPSKRRLQIAPVAVLFMAIVWVVIELVLARFVHYHSQNRLLRPSDYKAEVVSAADYALLSNPDAVKVRLSDGSEVHKAEIWHSTVLPNYKPLDGGNRYVLVTVNGTAALMPALLATLMPVLVMLVIGLAFAVMPLVRRGSRQKEQPA